MGERLDEARAVAERLLADLGLELVDLELVGQGGSRVLRATVDRDGGVDLDALGAASEALSPALDRLDPVQGRYALEVSSPGVERSLRRPSDFARSIGTQVSVQTRELAHGERRHQGILRGVDSETFSIELDGSDVRSFRFDEVDRVRTIFEWGPAPRPSSRRGRTARAVPAGREAEAMRR